MKAGTSNLLAALLALALACPLASCAQSAPIGSEGTGGATGSGGSGSGGSGSGSGSGSGGMSGSGGSSGGSQGSGGSGSGSGGQVAASDCGGTQGAGLGGRAAVSDAGTGNDDSSYANFATVQQIVQLKCGGSSCHNAGQNPMFQDDSNLYTALTTSKAPDCMNLTLVQPGAPSQSAMYLAISGACQCVPQMPDGCTGGDPNGPEYSCLPPDYIEGVRQWIANGAPKQ
jgi:hypothetical protein